MTASALRGAMGSENSQPPAYAGEVFRAVWEALKEGAQDLPERARHRFYADNFLRILPSVADLAGVAA